MPDIKPNIASESEQGASAPNAEMQISVNRQLSAKMSTLESNSSTSPAGHKPCTADVPTRSMNPRTLERYIKHAEEIGSASSDISYLGFIKRLGLLSSYRDFKAGTDNLFKSISQQAPALCNEELCYPGEKPLKVTEKHMVEWFEKAYCSIKQADFSVYPLVKPMVEYRFVGRHSNIFDSYDVKPDIALFFPNCPREDISDVHFFVEAQKTEIITLSGQKLGQIADYAYNLWKVQPMRKFVPVFLLNGCRLSMMIFARNDCHRIELGAMFRTEVETDLEIDEDVANTLSRLWFLIVQPPDKFGHIANVSVEASRFIFSGSAANAAVRAVDIMNIEFTDEERSRLVNIGNKIDRRIRVLGRLAHIYNVKYGDKRAFLKLSWIKPDRYLEGALYDVLQQSAIDGIPAVYSSGVLCKDSFDYRLEYLLLEDCGETVWDIIKQFVGKKVTIQKIYRVVPLVIKSVMRYLLRAHSAGVMHRDISPGNISIRENDVFIIDWGCSRLVTNGSEDQNKLFNQLAAKWDFNLKEIIDKEKMRDPLTGTHEYMSIRVLLGTAKRNIFDDIESLFYVVLHLLQCAKKEQVTDFLDTRHMSNYVSAVLKVGNMCGPQFYQKRAGIETYPDDLLQMVDNLYNMLFMVDGVNICSKLLDCAPEMRKLDCHFLCSIIGKDAFDDIFPSHFPDSSGNAIKPSSIGVISAFSQSESTDATKALGKRKAEEESDEDDDAFYKRFKDLSWLQF